jgi:hypothetical protein
MGDGFHPFTDPFMRALKLKEYVDEIKFRREQLERERQQFAYQVEQHKRARQMQDLQTRLTLEAMDALPVESGLAGKIHAGLAGRGTAETLIGQYSLPTQGQRSQKAYRDAEQKGIAAGITDRAKQDVTNPEVTIDVPSGLPGPFQTFKQTVREKDRMRVLNEMYRKSEAKYKKDNPNLVFREVIQGPDKIILGLNPKTGEEKSRKVLKGAGKLVGVGKEPLPTDSEINSLMDKWRPNLYNSRGITQDVIGTANGADVIGLTFAQQTTARKDAQSRITTVEKQLRDAAEKEIKARIRNRYLNQERSGVTVTTPQTYNRSKPYAGKSIREDNVIKAAKAKGMTTQQFINEWQAGGGRIIPRYAQR